MIMSSVLKAALRRLQKRGSVRSAFACWREHDVRLASALGRRIGVVGFLALIAAPSIAVVNYFDDLERDGRRALLAQRQDKADKTAFVAGLAAGIDALVVGFLDTPEGEVPHFRNGAIKRNYSTLGVDLPDGRFVPLGWPARKPHIPQIDADRIVLVYPEITMDECLDLSRRVHSTLLPYVRVTAITTGKDGDSHEKPIDLGRFVAWSDRMAQCSLLETGSSDAKIELRVEVTRAAKGSLVTVGTL